MAKIRQDFSTGEDTSESEKPTVHQPGVFTSVLSHITDTLGIRASVIK